MTSNEAGQRRRTIGNTLMLRRVATLSRFAGCRQVYGRADGSPFSESQSANYVLTKMAELAPLYGGRTDGYVTSAERGYGYYAVVRFTPNETRGAAS